MMLRQPRQVISADLETRKSLSFDLFQPLQLEEVLVDFWFNHFNVFEGKAQDLPLIASYERDAIRPNVLGKFKDLLLATARHPAMLYYLDNWESVSPAAFEIGPFAGNAQNMAQQLQRQARGLNENYGRELMELHTLGVDGGYTQDDVIAVARCFTGWTIRQPNTQPEFVFAGFMHDPNEKIVLGHKIAAGGGEQDGLAVIDILAHHRSTARFISKELAQRFVADNPPASLVDRMAQTFTKTDGDLRAVMETMFTSPEFFSEGASASKAEVAFRDGRERCSSQQCRRGRYVYPGAEKRGFGAASVRQAGTHGLPDYGRKLAEHREFNGPSELRKRINVRSSPRRKIERLGAGRQRRRHDRERANGSGSVAGNPGNL